MATHPQTRRRKLPPKTGLGVSLGRSWLEKHARVPEPVPPLFHYTGAEGIKGILESNRMWATGAQHMNDWSEVAYGHGIMTESLRATLSATRLSPRCQRVFSAVLDSIGSVDNPFVDAYFASFCEKGNLLSQWRAYAGTQGYSVEFDPVAINGSLAFSTNAPARNLYLAKVSYEPNEQRRSFERLLCDLCATFDGLDDQAISDMTHARGSQIDSVLLDFARIVVSSWAVTVKHPGFEEEQEWRVVFQPLITDQEKYYSTAEFVVRLEGKHLVTHVELMPADLPELKSNGKPRLPVKSITCGPSVAMRSALRALEILLRNHGYEGVEIRHSEIPATS